MHRFRLPASAATLLVALACLGSTAPASALEIRPTQTLSADVSVLGAPRPYQLHLLAQNAGASSTLQITLSRRATTGHHDLQTHLFLVRGISVSCTANLASCDLDTGTHMGSFGTVQLHFSAIFGAHTSPNSCAQTIFSGDHTSRKGTVSGAFKLVTGTAFFGTVRNGAAGVHVPATFGGLATKFHDTGGTCPAAPCSRQLWLQAVAPDSTTIFGSRVLPSGSGGVSLRHPDSSVEPDVSVTHGIEAHTSHGGFLKLVSNTPTLHKVRMDLGSFGPFLGGTLAFTGGGALTKSGHKCVETDRHGTLVTDLVANFDGYGSYAWGSSTTVIASRFAPGP